MSAPVAPPVEAGRWSGFFRLPLAERQRRVALVAGLSERETRILSGDEGLSAELADHMVENAVGVATLPVGICVHLRVDGCDRVVPMAIEEPSVIAAASHAAKLLRTGGGVHTRVSPAHMIGQIQVLGVPDPAAAEAAIRGARAEIIARANACDPPLCACGGGAVDIDVRHLPPAGDGDPLGPMLVVHLIVDVRDAMGANAVNTMCERLAGRVEELSGGRVRLRILSNLADRRLVVASGRVPFAALRAKGESSPEALARGIEEASVFAERDPYRAATHNKGIMNGVDAVLVAFGQDWRAVEAGAPAYAARGGRYTALSRWRVVDGALCGTLELPLAVGVVGGVSKVHPGCQVARRVAGVRSAADLASLAAAVGLAQNLGALRALAAEGIQTGHMRVHARGVALAAGAIGPEVDGVARAIAAGARPLRPAAARAALRAAREPAARWDARAVEGRLGEIGERYRQPIAGLAETAFVPSDGERRCALLPLCVAEVLGLDPARSPSRPRSRLTSSARLLTYRSTLRAGPPGALALAAA
ncbi:MAG: hydroxymethylglutaryl-CoA reductase, degradative [Deltaproteobacteria bacterium]|nr:hydroxymethylglutaryl-CoA reductase, degradative [Deltaproteobacteria bacterium]